MKKLIVVLMWICVFPIMVAWVLIKGLIDLAYDMERARKRRSRGKW